MIEKLCKVCNLKKIICKEKCQKCYDKERCNKWYNNLDYKERKRVNYICYQRRKMKKGLPYDENIHNDRKINKPGEGTITQQGYRRLPGRGHPNSQRKSGCILEHVLVMSQHLKRPLRLGETVHHRNGNRLDNRIENLELWAKNHGPGQRVEDKVKWCREFLKMYGSEYPEE